MFKPNLVAKTAGLLEQVLEAIEKNGGIKNYYVSRKKDGVRMEGLDIVVGRSLKEARSILVQDRFKLIAEISKEINMVPEGEFYSHGMAFNEINRFYSNTDVTSAKELIKLKKLRDKGTIKKDFPGRNIPWLTTFHDSLKFWWFDTYIYDLQNGGFANRYDLAIKRLEPYQSELSGIWVNPTYYHFTHIDDMLEFYEESVEDGWEGLILTHKDHKYKFGRATLNQGTLLKLKDDKRKYDGVIIGIEEGTKIKPGVARTVTELGKSRTSKCKADREPSGLAKGFEVLFEDKGQFTVSLKSFDNEKKAKLLREKHKYIGRHFIYTGMPPIKDFPRHAHFKCWRDEK